MRFLTIALCCLLTSFAHPKLALAQTETPAPVARPKVEDKAIAAFIQSMRKQVPKGWEITYTPPGVWGAADDKTVGTINIERVAQIHEYHQGIINDTPFRYEAERAMLLPFSLRFDLSHWVSPEEYKRMKAQNQEIYGELNEMSRSMNSIDRKFDSYFPKTPEETARVNKYDTVKAQICSLPDFYFQNLSMNWSESGPGMWKTNDLEGYAQNVADAKPRKECLKVVQNLLKLLVPYEPVQSADH